MRSRARIVAGVILLLAGVLVVVDGLAAGPHAFGQGWYSVGGIVIAGLSLMGAGASVLCETRRTI